MAPFRVVSCPGTGWRGTKQDKSSEIPAMPAAIIKTVAGELSHTIPKRTGKNTAAMWLMVKATAAVGAISPGSAIFWK